MGSGTRFVDGPVPIPAHLVARKRVLITGAGGSIGSALASAVAECEPAEILLMDAAEQALYQIDRTLKVAHVAILANVCDAVALEEAFERHRPHIVFHAAAFKHVVLMESHPFAAVENNAVGTFVLAKAALRYGAEQFVLVSSDKAVDPVGVMGASKRLAELAALALQGPEMRVKAVRLGNVYGSQGSAVPLYQEQIAQGGPVTVTHGEATRYFLSLERAAGLLLFALSEELQSAVLVPELAEPIRIEGIARRLMEESGSQLQIVYTGLRPGEKLHEQLLSDEEALLGEPGMLLRPIQSKQISSVEAEGMIGVLEAAIRERNLGDVLDEITRVIPAYRPSETVLALRSAECGI